MEARDRLTRKLKGRLKRGRKAGFELGLETLLEAVGAFAQGDLEKGRYFVDEAVAQIERY